MPRICFVTCRRWPGISESDRLVQGALEARGAGVQARPWNEPGAGWGDFDAIVLRSNWDYHWDPEGFRGWLDRLEGAGARVWNPPPLVRWNLSKRYLLALQAAGVPTVPTVVLGRADPEVLATLMSRHGWSVVVVKPEIGASAHGTRLVTAATAAEAGSALESEGPAPLLVQPFVEEVTTRGEWSLVWVDGTFTHAVLKHPGPGDFRVQSSLGGTVRAGSPPAAVLAAAQAAVAALPFPALYARIDAVEAAQGVLIMEVEVNEPGLFFTHAPSVAERFALAVLKRL